MAKLSEYVKVAEAARMLGVSQNTLRSWAEAGKLPMHRNPANGYRLFRVNVNSYMESIPNPHFSDRLPRWLRFRGRKAESLNEVFQESVRGTVSPTNGRQTSRLNKVF